MVHKKVYFTTDIDSDTLFLSLEGELNIYTLEKLQKKLQKLLEKHSDKSLHVSIEKLDALDTAGAIFLVKMERKAQAKAQSFSLVSHKKNHLETLDLVRKKLDFEVKLPQMKELSFVEKTGKAFIDNYKGFVAFITFFGQLFATKLYYLLHIHTIRYKEILFEINESAVKALGIVALTSFLIGLVIAYQSAFQLKLYGANIFIVDMLGISIFRELAPLITAIVIAGRSGSSYTAQIGAMKITQEIDAMKTMGFEPFAFLVLPRILALMITMPILIFIADIMAILGGMIVSNIDLQITPALFIDRLNEVVAAKHFFIGLLKGPFFAFLIATIGIYRGLMVKDDTQSIGFNTTKSVVESIFAVIVCDAIFSIAFTNLGI
jgi:phospholipid/cholesterol/gamma-HCH transport system permease protein